MNDWDGERENQRLLSARTFTHVTRLVTHLLLCFIIVYNTGYGIAVAITVVLCFIIGAATYFMVRGQSVNFFVAGRSLPLWVVAVTLAAQSVDSNALLGNVDLSYK
jgi:Na+/proline symporter